MAVKKNYSRYFIILQEEEKGYSLSSDKSLSGYCKFEVKNDRCKISYYIQNLKKEKTPYFLILICGRKGMKKLINLGKINIDDYGRAEISFEYPIDDISSSGIGIDKVCGAAIAKFVDKKLLCVLDGSIDSNLPSDWMDYNLFSPEREKSEPKAEIEKAEPKEEEKNNAEVSENQKTSIFDKYEEMIDDKVNKETESVENSNVNASDASLKSKENNEPPFDDDGGDAEPPVGPEDTGEGPIKEPELDRSKKEERKVKDAENQEKAAQEEHKVESYDKSEEFFESIISGFEEVKDFNGEIKRCRWFKVPVEDQKSFYSNSDYNRYSIIFYPMISYYDYIKKYNHYMIGYKYDHFNNLKYIIYAIPGKKSAMEQPYGGKSGFVTWISDDSYRQPENEESYGYWLMFFDYNKSTVIVPIR